MSTPVSHIEPTKKPRAILATIHVNDKDLRCLSAECLRALVRSNNPPYLFARGGEVVYITSDECFRMSIKSVTPTFLCGCLTRAANFRGDHESKVSPPSGAINDLLSRPIREWGLPSLVAVTETPLLRPDGSVVDAPGFDESTNIFYAPSAGLTIPPLPARPTLEDARAAAAEIEDCIGEFPFADASSRANAYASLLTPLVRPVIAGCVPIALYDAPQPGNGKGLFVEAVALIHTGSSAAIRAAPRRDDDEWRKLLTSVIHSGNQLVVFDNLEDTLKSAALAAAVTSEIWQDRILGRTETISLVQRTIFSITGNNLSVGGDLARRCYWIRIDAKLSRPWLGRKFRHSNLKVWIRQNRGELLRALLVMASAWYVAGCPAASTPILGSFEQWSSCIGGILDFAGVPGFLGNLPDLYAQGDASEGQWESFLRAIRATFGAETFTVGQLLRGDPMRLGIGVLSALPDELEGANRHAIGRALLRRVDRRYGDERLHLTRAGADRTGVARWRVEVEA